MRIFHAICSVAICVAILSLGFSDVRQEKAKKKSTHPKVDWSISCEECHEKETPAAVKQWQQGKHGQINVGCFICHGDGEVEFYAKPGSERCGSCHSEQEVNFAKLPVKNCFFCHKGHTLKFHY